MIRELSGRRCLPQCLRMNRSDRQVQILRMCCKVQAVQCSLLGGRSFDGGEASAELSCCRRQCVALLPSESSIYSSHSSVWPFQPGLFRLGGARSMSSGVSRASVCHPVQLDGVRVASLGCIACIEPIWIAILQTGNHDARPMRPALPVMPKARAGRRVSPNPISPTPPSFFRGVWPVSLLILGVGLSAAWASFLGYKIVAWVVTWL